MLKFRRMWIYGCHDIYFKTIFCIFLETIYNLELQCNMYRSGFYTKAQLNVSLFTMLAHPTHTHTHTHTHIYMYI